MNHQETKELEIDVWSLVKTLWKKKFIIMLLALVVGGATFVVNAFILSEQYEGITRVYVVNTENRGEDRLSAQDFQLGNYLVKDYQQIILSPLVLNEAATNLGLQAIDTESISVEVPVDTRILTIKVTNSNPTEAARIANGIREVAVKKIIEVTKVPDVTTLEEAVVPESPVSPRVKRNTVLGVLVGGFLAVALVIFTEVIDDRVKRIEDIEEVLGIPVLGVIPMVKVK